MELRPEFGVEEELEICAGLTDCVEGEVEICTGLTCWVEGKVKICAGFMFEFNPLWNPLWLSISALNTLCITSLSF